MKKFKQKCKLEKCNNLSIALGLCCKHYKRYYRHERYDKYKIDKTLWTETNIAWIAGLIEGEGNFNIRSNKNARIRVRMTDLDVLEKCLTITKCGKIYGPYKRNNPKWKDAYEWTVHRFEEVILIINEIYTLMCSRRRAKIDELLISLKDRILNSGMKLNNFMIKGDNDANKKMYN